MTSTHLGPEPSLVFTNASGATSPNGASLAAEPIRVIVPIVVHPREVLLLSLSPTDHPGHCVGAGTATACGD